MRVSEPAFLNLQKQVKYTKRKLKGAFIYMVGIYFSGTGNTAYCITKVMQLLDETAETVVLSQKCGIHR